MHTGSLSAASIPEESRVAHAETIAAAKSNMHSRFIVYPHLFEGSLARTGDGAQRTATTIYLRRTSSPVISETRKKLTIVYLELPLPGDRENLPRSPCYFSTATGVLTLGNWLASAVSPLTCLPEKMPVLTAGAGFEFPMVFLRKTRS